MKEGEPDQKNNPKRKLTPEEALHKANELVRQHFAGGQRQGDSQTNAEAIDKKEPDVTNSPDDAS
ncbi:MAG: hypothetical protein WC802_04125 [Patescibacteria group bacterium]|jgi:hypothetical protein